MASKSKYDQCIVIIIERKLFNYIIYITVNILKQD